MHWKKSGAIDFPHDVHKHFIDIFYDDFYYNAQKELYFKQSFSLKSVSCFVVCLNIILRNEKERVTLNYVEQQRVFFLFDNHLKVFRKK